MDVTLIRIVLGLAICFAVHANPSYRNEEASNEALNPGLKGKEARFRSLKGKLSSAEAERLIDDMFKAAFPDRSRELEERVLSEEKREKPIYEEENPAMKGKEIFGEGYLTREEQELLDELFKAANAHRSRELEERVYSEEKREKPIFEEENPAMKGKEKIFASLEAKLTGEEQELLDELYSEGTDVGKRDSGIRDTRGTACWCFERYCRCNGQCSCNAGRCECSRR